MAAPSPTPPSLSLGRGRGTITPLSPPTHTLRSVGARAKTPDLTKTGASRSWRCDCSAKQLTWPSAVPVHMCCAVGTRQVMGGCLPSSCSCTTHTPVSSSKRRRRPSEKPTHTHAAATAMLRTLPACVWRLCRHSPVAVHTRTLRAPVHSVSALVTTAALMAVLWALLLAGALASTRVRAPSKPICRILPAELAVHTLPVREGMRQQTAVLCILICTFQRALSVSFQLLLPSHLHARTMPSSCPVRTAPPCTKTAQRTGLDVFTDRHSSPLR